MTALLAVELRRFLARRMVRILALLIVVGILAAGTIVFFKSSRTRTVPAIDVNVIQSRVVECTSDNFSMSGRRSPDETPEEFCDSFASQLGGDPRYHLTSLRETWLGVGAQLIIVAWLLGASFAGAEWHTGSMATLLTWEPRRARVFAAKLVACLVLVYLGAVAAELLLGGALLPAAVLRGTTEDVDAQWVRDAVGLLGRVGVACASGAALGYGLAMLGRNTAASLGAGFGYLLIVENLVRGFRPQWSGWLLGDNTAAFVGGAGEEVILGRSAVEAGLVMGLYAAVVLVAGWISFHRRDVT